MSKVILWNDAETTGTDFNYHAITQIAMIVEIDGKIEGEYNQKIRPIKGKYINQKALEITGFKFEELETFQDPKEAYQDIRKFFSKFGKAGDKLNRFIPAGYENDFDLKFIHKWMTELDSEYAYWDYLQFSPIDILPYLRMLRHLGIINTENTKLKTMCDYFGIEIKAHDALSDVRATRLLTKKVYGEIINKMYPSIKNHLFN